MFGKSKKLIALEARIEVLEYIVKTLVEDRADIKELFTKRLDKILVKIKDLQDVAHIHKSIQDEKI